jgi:signal transduction histidine kinase
MSEREPTSAPGPAEDQPSRTPTVPPPTTAPADTLAAMPVEPRPVVRLQVELRVVGMVAALWWMGLVHALVWAHWAGPSWRDVAELPWLGLLAPQALALALVLGQVAHDLPRARWPRRLRKPRVRDPWRWLLAGPPALLVAPLLWWRDRAAQAQVPEPVQVEAAFRRLLHAPRSIALRFAGWAAVAYVVDAVVLGAHTGWPRHVVVAMALLWIAILGPLAAMVHGWSRAMLRPEILCAPRPDPGAVERRTDLRVPLVVAATTASAGAIVAPLCAGYLWLSIASPVRAPPLLDLLLVVGLVALAACVIAFVIMAVDLRRDVLWAAAQVQAVVQERPPQALVPGSLSSREVQQLVEAVDRLIGRIRQATVAKYVAIERAKEGDRLKSQFLANMSHDLRSPLNSILGFSELLLRGIDGELTAEQAEMMQQIHDCGRELLQQIDDILDTAKLEARRLDLHPEPTPPANLISRAIKAARERQRGDIQYEAEVAPGLRPAFVDPFRAVQALTNILLFAGERMPAGTLQITLRERWVAEGPRILLQVFTPVKPASTEHLARSRTGFYRIPGHRGLGLGLPLAGAILELSGGSLSVEDRGEGMIFTAIMPAPQSKASWLRMRALVETEEQP